MSVRVISIVKKFHCLAKDCPYTCCKGWHIPIDKETEKHYLELPGIFGRHVRFHMKGREQKVLRKFFGRCNFQDSEKHCLFQDMGREDLMPLVCRVYPREPVQYVKDVEITLELSCIAAARMFLQNPGRLEFVPGDEQIPIWEIANEDEGFLKFLRKDRGKILDYFWGSSRSLPLLWQDIYAYVYKEHEVIMRKGFEEVPDVEISAVRGRDFGYAFFSVQSIDRMIIDHIDYGVLCIRDPKFYHLIKSYNLHFRKQSIRGLDDRYSKAVKEMLRNCPGYEEKYRSYFSYNIQQLYLKALESYLVLREFLFAVLYTQLLITFDLVEYLDTKAPASLERQAEILMLCEQGIRHNPSLTKNLLEIIRQDFL